MNPREMSEREKLIGKLHDLGLTDRMILGLVLREIDESADAILRTLVEYYEEDKK